MENDENKNNDIIESNLLNNNIFKLDYFNQNLTNNIKFTKWNQLMIKEYGNNIKLFKCKVDNIFFYLNYDECLKIPPFAGKCPLCNNYVCLFCSFYFKKDVYSWESCCRKRSIYKAFFFFGFKNIKKLKENYYKEHMHLLIFIPGLNSFILFIKIIDILFLDVAIEKSKYINDNYESPRGRLEKNTINFVIVIALTIAFSILLSIIYIFYNAIFLFALVIISIPFKFYPIQYYYDFLDDYFY